MIKKAMFAVAVLQFFYVPQAFAQDGNSSASPWMMRGRVIGVLPDSGGHTTIGGTPEADNAAVPEFDISYFFTPYIAAELILATSPHDLTLKLAW